VLVIGGGPAGLECALQLANRGYPVTLAEAIDALGGRVSRESELPGMSSYARVRDYRENLLRQRPNVAIYLENRLSAQDVVELEIAHVLVATGARWRSDGIGRQHHFPIPGIDRLTVMTPDDVLDGAPVSGRVLIYDDDHYFMGSTIAERYRDQGLEVCLVTPASMVSVWTENTLEQHKIQHRMLALGVEVIVSHELVALAEGKATIANVYSEAQRRQVDFDTLIMVTARLPRDELYQELLAFEDRFKSLRAIGDCHAPGTVAAAVYDGHSAARQLESGEDIYAPWQLESGEDIYAPLFTRDLPVLE
jgi:dimethylamine/trimethylamine dehydrogenase